jgi:hypothetical protein
MAHVTPSEVRRIIERAFPHASQGLRGASSAELSRGHEANVTVVLSLLDQIPTDLLLLDIDDFAGFAASVATLRAALQIWPVTGDFRIRCVPGFDADPATLIYEALAKCPESAPAAGTPGLRFLRNRALRAELRADISVAHQAYRNAEWKPAAVMAGAVVEALLLWRLQREPASQRSSAAATLVPHTLKSAPPPDILRWGLHQLLEVAAALSVIDAQTAEHCRLAKDYRNLIHPGLAERQQVRSTKSTALAALSAMERVVECFSR